MKNKTHHTRRGFRNNYPHDRHNLGAFFKFLWGFKGKALTGMSFPVAANDPKALAANRERNTLTWIGHSTFLVQMNALNILTDPHFTRRASPLKFAGPERFTPPGLALKDLPSIDVVLISHNHY